MADGCEVLFVDDEQPLRTGVEQWLRLSGVKATTFASAEPVLSSLHAEFEGVLVTDVRLPGMDGLALLREALRRDRDLPVVLLTGHGDVAMAVEAMRDGAYDFLEKPFEPNRLLETVRRACEKRRLVLENRRLRRAVATGAGVEARLLGTSAAITQLRREVLELAAAHVNVVIQGETGSGKELVARCLHDLGPRAAGPFVAVNCGAVPEAIFESEFFGHEAGAFTGAAGRRAGKLEHAHGGTLLLDEVESMPLALQVKLLRVLEERAVERLGSHQRIPADVRTVAATKVDLLQAVQRGTFREDLYYRLAVAQIGVPPLRQRREDIPLLFEYFAAESARAHARAAPPLREGELALLVEHGWPGNVRELRNAAERFALGLGGLRLVPQGPGEVEAPPQRVSLPAQVADFERRAIERVLAQCQGDVTAALAILEIPRRTLNEKMARYGIDRQRFVR
jgi:two-component system, NtrC family, C4-dicarboxylate transport response regulator DctD